MAEIAGEILLREGEVEPNAIRDAGVYRYLFEHALGSRLELDRRKLLWMSWFWSARGEHELAKTAAVLAWQLMDPQHIVPSHPFLVELTTRSLIAARKSVIQRIQLLEFSINRPPTARLRAKRRP